MGLNGVSGRTALIEARLPIAIRVSGGIAVF